MTTIAQDKSMRRLDADGHLHVEMTNISKANVCPYYGREIPDYERLGLHPARVYMLYRDPAELQRAAPTFAGKPLLMHHQPVTADEHPEELVVGTLGTDIRYEHPYLKAPLSVWTQDAIDAIDSKKQEQLSSGYRYRADMISGRSPEGVAYDGVMRDIKANHVALVRAGRAGPDVLVADEKPAEFLTMRFKNFFTALASAFPALQPEQVVALDSALAADGYDLSEDEMKAACDALSKELKKDALSDEEKTEAYKRAAKDKAMKAAPAGPVGGAPKPGMDEAAVKLAVDAAVAKATEGMISKADADAAATLAADAAYKAATAETIALYEARKTVEPTAGVVALDSAEAVYRFALDALKVVHKELPATALAALYEASVKVTPAIAHDAAVKSVDVRDMFPGLKTVHKG